MELSGSPKQGFARGRNLLEGTNRWQVGGTQGTCDVRSLHEAVTEGTGEL